MMGEPPINEGQMSWTVSKQRGVIASIWALLTVLKPGGAELPGKMRARDEAGASWLFATLDWIDSSWLDRWGFPYKYLGWEIEFWYNDSAPQICHSFQFRLSLHHFLGGCVGSHCQFHIYITGIRKGPLHGPTSSLGKSLPQCKYPAAVQRNRNQYPFSR